MGRKLNPDSQAVVDNLKLMQVGDPPLVFDVDNLRSAYDASRAYARKMRWDITAECIPSLKGGGKVSGRITIWRFA